MSTKFNFCSFAERYNDKMNMWDEVLVTIDKTQIYFYDKKAAPKHQTDRFVPILDVYSLEKCQAKRIKEYKIGNSSKINVISLYCDEKTSLFSFKAEMQMNMCYETIIYVSSKKKSYNQLSHRKTKPAQKKIFSKLHQDSIINNNKENIKKCNMIINENKSTCNLLTRPKIERLRKQVKEENKPLNTMINDMLNGSGQKNVTFSVQRDEKEYVPDHEGSELKKRSLNQIIQLSLKKTSSELITSNVSLINTPISPKQVSTYFPLQYDFDGSVDEGMMNSSFYNNNQSFSLPQALIPNDKILNIINRIENYEIHIYDSFIVKKMIKDNILTKEDFGKIYSQLSNINLKSRLLIEMIAICSKRKLKSLIKQKNPDDKIEMLILDIFNGFLGNNTDSTYLYDKILPGELNDIYHIEILLDIKKQISLPNLFIVMEYKNRIYFNDNLDVNFLNSLPFVEQDIKYISPYLMMKWNRFLSFNTCNSNIQTSLTMTNIKRIPINPQLSMNDNEKQDEEIKLFKESEISNDETRISLVMDIYQLIYEKKYELSLKLCNFYVQKYTDTIFLNPIVYLILLEIYNQTIGIDIAELFFDKSCHILNWLYPNNGCHLIVDVYYTYSLMLMKQTDHYIHDNITYVADIMIKTKSLCEMFYNESNEKYIKIHLQYYLFNYLYMEKTLSYEEITSAISAFSSNEFKTKEVYFQLFIDSLNGDFCNRSTKNHLYHALTQLRKEQVIQ